MHALKRKTPLAESFLAQLDVDLEGAGIPTDYESSVDALKKKGFVRLLAPQRSSRCSSCANLPSIMFVKFSSLRKKNECGPVGSPAALINKTLT